MSDIKTFTISQLPQIKSISDDDLLIVSDYDKSTLTTKKMSISQLVQFILSNKIDELVKKNIESNLSDAILNTISANNEFVADVLDGVRDDQLIIGSTQGA